MIEIVVVKVEEVECRELEWSKCGMMERRGGMICGMGWVAGEVR